MIDGNILQRSAGKVPPEKKQGMLGIFDFKVHAGDFGDGLGDFNSLAESFSLAVKGKTFGRQTMRACAAFLASDRRRPP